MKLLIIIASTLSLLVVTQVSTILAGGHGQPTFMWTRTVHVAAGQGPKASELAMKIKKYVEKTHFVQKMIFVCVCFYIYLLCPLGFHLPGNWKATGQNPGKFLTKIPA